MGFLADNNGNVLVLLTSHILNVRKEMLLILSGCLDYSYCIPIYIGEQQINYELFIRAVYMYIIIIMDLNYNLLVQVTLSASSSYPRLQLHWSSPNK